MTEETQSRPFYEDDETWLQDATKATDKLDKKLGWSYNDSSNDKDKEWSYDKLLAKHEHLQEVTLKNMPEIWQGLEFALAVKTILIIMKKLQHY